MSSAFLNAASRQRVQAAIAAAEGATSAEIRVRVQPRGSGDPVADAERWFVRLGMARTAERNGTLIYVAWKDRQFAVVGDAGIHERVGPDFWRTTAAALAARFAAGDYVGGLEAGVRSLGDVLAAHFPRPTDARNELPDEISEG